jgi:hypothetical protein
LVKARDVAGKCLIIAGQNRGPLKIFQSKTNNRLVPVLPSDVSALLTYKNGKSRRQEIYYGTSFLSQSGRFLNVSDMINSVEITDSKGNKRQITL